MMTRSRALASAAAVCALWVGTAQGKAPFIVLACTTSTENSGLLDALLPTFTEATGVGVRVVAKGTGQAIRIAANGDADVLLVHHTPSEERFVAEGHGVARHDIMYNDFVIVGPRSDPAGVRGLSAATTAFERIAKAEAAFASRGDDSGTHKRELELWKETDVDVRAASGTWYRETGSGMGATLNVAQAMGAYALSDRATWLHFANKHDLELLLEGDPPLLNQYGIILVDVRRHPNVRSAEARSFVDWMLSPDGQQRIGAYSIDGQPVFFPNAAGSDPR